MSFPVEDKGRIFYARAMQYRELGKTGLQVSAVGFGAWAIGGNAHGDSYGSTDDTVSMSALNRAYELGCTFFDTADLYGHGHSEQLIGKALKGWEREKVVIASKGGHDFSPEVLAQSRTFKKNFSESHLCRAVEDSLRRLGVDAIDLYQLHNPPIELIQHGKVFEILQDLKKQGKIRFYGISIHDPQEGIQAIEIGQVDTIQAIWNLFDTRIEKQLVELCTQTGTGLIIREPLARGFLTGKFTSDVTFEKGDTRAVWPRPLIQKRIEAASRFQPFLPEGYRTLAQLAIAYPLLSPAVSTVIPGCKSPAQVEENLGVADLPPLSAETRVAIRQVQEAL